MKKLPFKHNSKEKYDNVNKFIEICDDKWSSNKIVTKYREFTGNGVSWEFVNNVRNTKNYDEFVALTKADDESKKVGDTNPKNALFATKQDLEDLELRMLEEIEKATSKKKGLFRG